MKTPPVHTRKTSVTLVSPAFAVEQFSNQDLIREGKFSISPLNDQQSNWIVKPVESLMGKAEGPRVAMQPMNRQDWKKLHSEAITKAAVRTFPNDLSSSKQHNHLNVIYFKYV